MAHYFLKTGNLEDAVKHYNKAKKSFTLYKNISEKEELEALENQLKQKGLLK